MDNLQRCGWVTDDEVYINYHDYEWGRPVRSDNRLFEMLSLEGAQAGLSWLTILKRRENYRKAFDNFDLKKVSTYHEEDMKRLMQDKGIIRNQLKVKSVITNARCSIEVQTEFGSLANYFWSFVQGEPIINNWKTTNEVPSSTRISEQMSKDLKKRGFKFVGPVICYSFMQAVGMVDDHIQSCFLASSKQVLK